MQQEGKPQFIRAHAGDVKGVAFSPTERYVFCSGGADGKVVVYNALHSQLVKSTKMLIPSAMKIINAVKFNADGSRILSMTTKRLAVIDAERSEVICSYENCAYPGKDRAPLATNPKDPFMAICSCTNGKGLITFDLRQQKPAHTALNVHSSVIKDIMYLDSSWPYGERDGTVVSLGADGTCKIRTIDDRVLDVIVSKSAANCMAATHSNCFLFVNGSYHNSCGDGGLDSRIVIGGNDLIEYLPPMKGRRGEITANRANCPPYYNESFYKLKYTSSGHLLYSVSNGGRVTRYQRCSTFHDMLGVVYTHEEEILDMDISANDEYIVTASRNGTVGLLCLGAPSFGWTGYMELA